MLQRLRPKEIPGCGQNCNYTAVGMTNYPKNRVVQVRVPEAVLHALSTQAADHNTTKTKLLLRGAVLALQELEEQKQKQSDN